LKSILKKSIDFESPSKINIDCDDKVKDTVKKGQLDREFILRKEDNPAEVISL
jgi:hypothetical protein